MTQGGAEGFGEFRTICYLMVFPVQLWPEVVSPVSFPDMGKYVTTKLGSKHYESLKKYFVMPTKFEKIFSSNKYLKKIIIRNNYQQ